MNWEKNCRLAAEKIAEADAILIGAGAGMGVDSGLPDFRGDKGFWNAYPPFKEAGIRFVDAADPIWFSRHPRLAWGFYGHRFNLYNSTKPHAGYQVLLDWSREKSEQCFVFTSNVDGQFQRAGFSENQLIECHGSIHYWQCSVSCSNELGKTSQFSLMVDDATFLADPPLPLCHRCGATARPNILMFRDSNWVAKRTNAQEASYRSWLQTASSQRVVIIELGAGTAVPTVRWESESRLQSINQTGGVATLVRINPRDTHVPEGQISIATGARQGLDEINRWIVQ